MSKQVNLPYNFMWSTTHPHIAWADIHGNGTIVEIAVVALDNNNGDLYFIPIASLDSVDSNRLLNIIMKRDAAKYPLWDLMSNTTLKNGLNALEYFNQLVKVRSVSGQIFAPHTGKMGALSAQFSTKPSIESNRTVTPNTESTFSDTTTITEDVAPRRGPGRPPVPK